MPSIGLLVEFNNGRIKDSNFGLATAARASGQEIAALALDAAVDAAKPALEAYGVDRIINVLASQRISCAYRRKNLAGG